jgi:Flp pilus assembly protein CpaB
VPSSVSEWHVGNILRRVAIVLGLVSALMLSWIRRVETPSSSARVAIFRGEALVPGRLAPQGPGPEVKITPGKRAFSFRINDPGNAGLIQPNSRVDIIVVLDSGAEKGRVAKVLMENMRVLAINEVSGYLTATAVATVEVTPAEAERLTIATTQGQIRLMLRGYGKPNSAPRFRAANVREFQCWGPRDSVFHDALLRKCSAQKNFQTDSPTLKRDSLRARR